MQLFLLRHADADTEAASDRERALSEKGIAQADKVGQFLADQECAPEMILSSPLRRAQETATLASSRIKVEVRVVPWLASGLDPVRGLKELSGLGKVESMMLVGHEPDFSRLAAHLLGLPTPTALHLRKASLTLLSLEIFKPGAAHLEFSIPCKLI